MAFMMLLLVAWVIWNNKPLTIDHWQNTQQQKQHAVFLSKKRKYQWWARKNCSCYFTCTSVADSENQIKIGHQNLVSQQNDNISRSVGETSLKQENLQKRSKSTKCYIHFHNFPESSEKNLMLFHIYKCHRFRKSNQNKAPELGIPAEWQHSKANRRNVTQTRKTSKAVKINEMLYSFSQLSGIIGKKI